MFQKLATQKITGGSYFKRRLARGRAPVNCCHWPARVETSRYLTKITRSKKGRAAEERFPVDAQLEVKVKSI